MVSNPCQWIESLASAGADQMTVHYETVSTDALETSRRIREAGMRAALAFKPKTVIDSAIMKLLETDPFDMLLVMTVGTCSIKIVKIEPGFGG